MRRQELNLEATTKNSGAMQYRATFESRPTTTPRNMRKWRLTLQEFTGSFSRTFVEESRVKINGALDKSDGKFADTAEDALNLVKLTAISLEIASSSSSSRRTLASAKHYNLTSQ